MNNWRRLKIYGPPGTGKTRTLHSIVSHLTGHSKISNHEVLNNLPFNAYTIPEITYISFTNSAIAEFLRRMDLPVVDGRSREAPYFRTMHGVAEKLLIAHGLISTEQRMKIHAKKGGPMAWYWEFCRKHKIRYSHDILTGTSEGNVAWLLYSLAMNRFYPEFGDRAIDKITNEYSQYAWIIDAWLRYKKKENILDYVDFLTMVYDHELKPPTKVLLADEFQDFSKLQYEIFKRWSEDQDYVIIAGDDDQAIMTFQGASPEFILSWDTDEELILDKSHRIPKSVHDISMKLIAKVKHRKHKRFDSRDETGIVVKREFSTLNALAIYVYKVASLGYSVEVLFRTNEDVEKCARVFLSMGIPFKHFKRQSFWQELEGVVNFFVELSRGKHPSYENWEAFLRYSILDAKTRGKILNALTNGFLPLDVYTKLLKNPFAFLDREKIVSKYGSGAERIFYELSTARRQLPEVGQIVIDTIHSAKGTEADVVVVVDKIPGIIEKTVGDPEAFENEVRVWYVGVTRPKQMLTIANIGGKRFLEGLI